MDAWWLHGGRDCLGMGLGPHTLSLGILEKLERKAL